MRSLRYGWRGWCLLGMAWCGLTALAARADDAEPPGLKAVQYWGQHYLVRFVDPRKEDLRLYWKDDQGNLLRDFAGLEKAVKAKGERLLFAANAGMFEPDSKPVGLLVQNGVERSPLNLNDGTGNFYLKPNGVFVLNEKHEARVVGSDAYTELLSPAVWATQSGPLLVNDAEIHPDFIESSTNKKIRSGVGVRRDGTIVFAISTEPVNLYHFASFFLAGMKCPNALYLDGEISAFYVPGGKETGPHSFGPMFGLVEKAKNP
ncbi:MAG: phosphodiester glycosidase family protein [Methylacidiphilales bacterium]|nr:phosphodiester glycosidase family protein [Candidatus Methylacidiphilales bacterium]